LDTTTTSQVEQVVAEAPDSRSLEAPWSLAQRIFFRFVCSYLVLYITPNLLSGLPGGSWLSDTFEWPWHKLAPWVAIHTFHLSGKATTYFETGSGDTTLAYIENLLCVLLAALAAVVWSVADHRRKDYRCLHSWLRVAVRYALAYIMLGYAFFKVFPVQFGSGLEFMWLTQPYGDFSPMGVLWKFMAASTGYTFFGGMCEAVGATLLFFRRTTTLGAAVSFGVLLNIVLLNFSYDVPVKLYSSNLLLMAIFLMAPDLRRLLNFLVLNRGNEPADLSAPRFERRWIQISAILFQIFLVGWFFWSTIDQPWKIYKQRINDKRPPLYGLYAVETFSRNGQELPPLITDASRWKKVCIQHPDVLGIRLMDDSAKYYNAQYYAATNAVALWERGEKSQTNVLAYSWIDADQVVLQGELGTNALSIHLHRIDMSKILLVNRGFHWINELPFNR
jgi:hypothetical protein